MRDAARVCAQFSGVHPLEYIQREEEDRLILVACQHIAVADIERSRNT